MLGGWTFAWSVGYRFGVRPTRNPIFGFGSKGTAFL